jgi:hypothetical protein
VWSLLVYVSIWLQHAREWLTPVGFHPSAAASPVYAPQLPLLPESLVWPFAVAFLGSLGAIILLPGSARARRVGLAVALACTIYVTLVDPIAAFTLNRLYIVGLAVLLAAPEPSAQGRVSAWPVRVLQLTVVIHYACAGWCKAARGDWLAQDDVLWTQVQGVYATEAAAWLVRELPRAAWTAMQHLALGFELAAPLLLGIRRLRPLGFALGLGLHAVVAITMAGIGLFSLQMATFYVLFMDPRWVERVRARLSRRA